MKTETEIRQRISEMQIDIERAIRAWEMKKGCELRGAAIDRIENGIFALEWVLKENTENNQSDK
jgi:hypothetical protein